MLSDMNILPVSPGQIKLPDDELWSSIDSFACNEHKAGASPRLGDAPAYVLMKNPRTYPGACLRMNDALILQYYCQYRFPA